MYLPTLPTRYIACVINYQERRSICTSKVPGFVIDCLLTLLGTEYLVFTSGHTPYPANAGRITPQGYRLGYLDTDIRNINWSHPLRASS